jgi:DNA polymerase III delta subunit
MKPDAFINALKKEIPALTVCTGEEQFFKEEVFQALKGHLERQDPGLELIHWESLPGETETTQAHRLVAEMQTPGLFSPRKLIFCRDGAKLLKEAAKVIAPLASPGAAANNLCLFTPKIDGRTTFARELKKSGSLVECKPLYAQQAFFRSGGGPSELAQWTKRRAAGQGMKLDDKAVEFLLSLTGNSLFLIDSELQKLALGEKEAISVADIEEITGMSALHDPFTLWEKIEKGDPRDALKTMKVILRNGLRSRDGKAMTDPAGIAAVLLKIFRDKIRIAAASIALKREGRSDQEIQELLRVKAPFAYRKAQEYARSLTGTKYNLASRAILEAERKIKRQGLATVPVLEEAVLRLAIANRKSR